MSLHEVRWRENGTSIFHQGLLGDPSGKTQKKQPLRVSLADGLSGVRQQPSLAGLSPFAQTEESCLALKDLFLASC